MKSTTRRILFAILTICLVPMLSFAAGDREVPDRNWLEGFTLIELGSDDVASLHRTLALVQSYGGHIAIISPPSLLMGWVPFELRPQLIGKANIKDIYFTDVLPGEVEIRDEQTRHMVTYFNRVIRGEYQEYVRNTQVAPPPVGARNFLPDALDSGPLDEEAYLDNLRANGFDLRSLEDRGILINKSAAGIQLNSDKMVGTVTATLIFVESDGSSTDPDTYTWTDQHVQDYVAGVNTGLVWWSAQAKNYGSCWVAFFVRYFPPTDSRCRQWRESILHPSLEVYSMVSEVMSNFGYSSGMHTTRVHSFNTAQKATYGTDWAYTGFIAYNPPPAPTALTDGYSAWAYRGGPYTFLLYRSFGWAVDQVFTHETGHIFWACDEYYQAGYGGCMSCGVCANGVDNGNCDYCATSVPCMMHSNSFTLCPYTPGHLGWEITPCAPAPLTPPTADAIMPASGTQGTGMDVTISGSDFLYGAFAELGAGITINSSEVVGSDTLRLSISIENTATTGPRNVVVKNRDLQSSTITGGFEVMTSTRHYVSATGGDVFPYLTAANAATSIDDAIDAAADGDTVLVESGTFNLTTLDVSKGVTLSGAWVSGFGTRDLETGKTILDLSGNITITSGSGETVFEGFIVQNGTGFFDFTPVDGYYGGGFKITNSTVRISDCEILQNQATAGAGFGGGGGIFASGSSVTIENNHIHDNTATYGGGIYLFNSSGVINDNTITGNAVSFNTVSPAGGGIALDECADITLNGNTVHQNTGSQGGGGLWAKNSTGVSLEGGLLSYNTASLTGAGAEVSRSEVDFVGVEFLHNTSSAIGGGLTVTDTSDATLRECRLLWNSAVVGAGLYQTYGHAEINHNLFVGNGASSSGGAIYLVGVTAGEVIGNTLDRNAGPTGGGGMLLDDVPIEVYNNVVVNTTGDGMTCSGSAPILINNNVWNSSGSDYDGCDAGTGSISSEPLFVDTALVDYHLAEHSPAIDTGRPGASYDDPDGSPGDMGLYGSHLFMMDQPSYPKNLAAEIVSGEVVLSWDKNPEGDVDKYAVYSDTESTFNPSASNFVTFVTAPDTSVNLGVPGDTIYYKVSAVDTDGYAGGYSDEATITPTGIGDDVASHSNRLYQNVPNPFNPTTTMRYEIRERSAVRLFVYDVGGRLVKRLVDTTHPAGVYTVDWDGTNEAGQRVSSGIYFYKLTSDDFTQTKKMVLLK